MMIRPTDPTCGFKDGIVHGGMCTDIEQIPSTDRRGGAERAMSERCRSASHCTLDCWRELDTISCSLTDRRVDAGAARAHLCGTLAPHHGDDERFAATTAAAAAGAAGRPAEAVTGYRRTRVHSSLSRAVSNRWVTGADPVETRSQSGMRRQSRCLALSSSGGGRCGVGGGGARL